MENIFENNLSDFNFLSQYGSGSSYLIFISYILLTSSFGLIWWEYSDEIKEDTNSDFKNSLLSSSIFISVLMGSYVISKLKREIKNTIIFLLLTGSIVSLGLTMAFLSDNNETYKNVIISCLVLIGLVFLVHLYQWVLMNEKNRTDFDYELRTKFFLLELKRKLCDIKEIMRLGDFTLAERNDVTHRINLLTNLTDSDATRDKALSKKVITETEDSFFNENGHYHKKIKDSSPDMDLSTLHYSVRMEYSKQAKNKQENTAKAARKNEIAAERAAAKQEGEEAAKSGSGTASGATPPAVALRRRPPQA